MEVTCVMRQRGVVVVLVATLLPVFLIIMGLALDYGNVFVRKTQLQNALDATALSAAITLNVTKNTGTAANAGIATFNNFKTSSGNSALSGLKLVATNFQFSDTLDFDSPGARPPAFVKVTSKNMLLVTPILIKVLDLFKNDIQVDAYATAGPVGQNCSLVPFVLCADVSGKVDTDCSDGQCYGYTIGSSYTLNNLNNPSGNSVNSGFFNLLNTSANISTALLSTTNICPGANLDVSTPWLLSNVTTGINNRFTSDTLDHTDTTPPEAYSSYVGNGRRVMAVPVADCSISGASMPKVGVTCIFLSNSTSAGSQVTVEITGKFCQQNGVWDPNNPVLNGPYKIVLFKSKGRRNS